MKGFKEFILRGNVLDLAVAVVMGAAFGAVVTALVKDLLTPLIAAIVGAPDFSGIALTVNGSKLLVGDFLNAIIAAEARRDPAGSDDQEVSRVLERNRHRRPPLRVLHLASRLRRAAWTRPLAASRKWK
jgi:hypothetical protein